MCICNVSKKNFKIYMKDRWDRNNQDILKEQKVIEAYL